MTVTTQKSLNAAMKDKKVTTIVIKTNKDIDLSIPTGKYTSKSVEIIAPKASLINKATLKGMTIKSAKIVTEKADNNKIKITDKGLRINVSKGADNSKISIGTKDAKVTVVADGKVSSVTVNKKATVAVTGTTTKPVSVTSNASGTGLILSATSNAALKETTSVTVKKGADVGKITAYKNAIVDVVKGAKVNLSNSIGNKSSVKIDADGTVNKVALQKKASVTITGDTTKPVEVDNNAAGTVVNLAAKAIVNSSASASVNALRNAIIEYVEATKTLMLNLHGGSTVKEVKAIQDILLKLSKGSEVNSLTGSKNVDIKVAEGATLDSVKLVGKDVKSNVNINGTIEKIQIDKKADVKIKGTTQTPVNVTSNAAGAALDLSTAANLTLNENAKVNVGAGAKVGSLIVAKDVTLNVAPKAAVEELVVKGSDAKIDVTANGTVGSLTIDAKADVSIKGNTDKPVVVNANVESAKITTEVKTEVKANANVDITLGAGAEGSKVVAAKDVNASVKNETKENVTVTDSTGKENTVGSGSAGDTKPTPPAPYYPPVITPPTTTQKTVLTAEVIFGTGSKNLQIFFKDGDKYLTAAEIKALGETRLDEIVNGFRVEDKNNLLSLKKPSGEDTIWTIHKDHDNNTELDSISHDNCKVGINSKGYDVFEAWQWQGTKNSGDIYCVEGVTKDTGYLKIHLGANANADAEEWTGFSEDFAANDYVEIEYASDNYDITIKNYGGGIRKTTPDITLNIINQNVVYDGTPIDFGSDFSVIIDGKNVIKNGDGSYSIDGINDSHVSFSYKKVEEADKEVTPGLPTDVGSYELIVFVNGNSTYYETTTYFEDAITIAKDILEAEVIFGKESKNLQMLFKRGSYYLTEQEINSLNLSEIVRALSVTDTDKQLVLKSNTTGEKWTIHQVGTADSTTTHTCPAWNQEGIDLNDSCRPNIPSEGYGVYPASAWDGLSTGGVLTNTAPNAGFLKIHLGDNNALDSAWNGFSEDFNAKSKVTINFTSTNYEITVKNFGGAERTTPNGER